MTRAVRIQGAGGPEVLHLTPYDVPTPSPREILVKVIAAGLNRGDCLQRRGLYPAPKGVIQDVPGLEYAGVVAALGQDAHRFRVGDRVMGICGGGAMASHITVHEDVALPIPEVLSFAEAAAVPETFITAYDALYNRGNFIPNAKQTVLIHAVGSGVGTAALQLAKCDNATVVGTSRTEKKLVRAQALGLDQCLCVRDGQFAKQFLSVATNGADVILDFIGAAYLEQNVRCLATLGRLVVIGLLGGVNGKLPLGILLAKRASVIGTVLRSRGLEEKISLCRDFERDILPGFGTGRYRPVVDAVMPMTEISAAHAQMEENAHFGKIVMTW